MSVLFVVNSKEVWPREVPGASVVTARAYLTGAMFQNLQHALLINLCSCDRYQGAGYYVSLLAEARGQHCVPDLKTIDDLQSAEFIRMVSARFDGLIQELLPADAGERFEIDAYFGRDPTGRYASLCQQLFASVRAPLLRGCFERARGRWALAEIRAAAMTDVPLQHRSFLLEAMTEFVVGAPNPPRAAAPSARRSLAILHDGGDADPPSNAAALEHFIHAAETLGMHAEIVDRHALDRLEHFDALFIRDTTHIGHYTYDFSRRAAALGMVVIDDADSIVRANNKVYLNELLSRHRVPVPKTMLVHRDNLHEIAPALGMPCILKLPDSAFSLGVCKADSEPELFAYAAGLLEKSELIIAQRFLPTEFDWRVGILDRRVLFVCRYFMAPGHWQIIKRDSSERIEGRTRAVSVGEAPPAVVGTALRAANLIGSGFYGVDLKQVGNQCVVMEINDNPNVDAGNEDGVLKDALYREVMGVIQRRIEENAGLRASMST